MSYDEEQHKRSRVVVETPTARREVVHQQTVRYPEERRGHSTGLLVAVALVAIAATAIVFLFLTNSRDDSSQTNVNVRAAAATQPTPFTQTPVIVQTPVPMPTPQTVIIQQPPPTTTTVPAPVIVTQPPAAGTTTTAPPAATSPPANARAAAGGHDDASLQEKIDKAFADDPDISAANVDATVVNGRVKLVGTVGSEAVKQRAERLAYQVKGVLGVDNKIVVSP
jgi:hypothetical protein